jgi:hypothetical protein
MLRIACRCRERSWLLAFHGLGQLPSCRDSALVELQLYALQPPLNVLWFRYTDFKAEIGGEEFGSSC